MPTADKSQKSARPRDYSTDTRHKELLAKYTQAHEQIKLLVPKGFREQIQTYVTQGATENPGSPKFTSWNGRAYLPSVNAYINYLMRQDMGLLDETEEQT